MDDATANKVRRVNRDARPAMDELRWHPVSQMLMTRTLFTGRGGPPKRSQPNALGSGLGRGPQSGASLTRYDRAEADDRRKTPSPSHAIPPTRSVGFATQPNFTSTPWQRWPRFFGDVAHARTFTTSRHGRVNSAW